MFDLHSAGRSWIETVGPLHQGALDAVVAGKVGPEPLEFARYILRVEAGALEAGPAAGVEQLEHVPALFLASFLLFLAVDSGNTCLRLEGEWLRRLAGSADLEWLAEVLHSWRPSLASHGGKASVDWDGLAEELMKGLGAARSVGRPDRVPEGGCTYPLVLDRGLLYLQRYFSYEQRLAYMMRIMAQLPPRFLAGDGARRRVGIAAGIEVARRIFGAGEDGHGPDWQKIAALNGLLGRLTVVSGGPGTGKTRTVTAMTAVLQAASKEATGSFLKMAFCAPTGKAAARLSESVADAKVTLGLDQWLIEAIPAEAQTLHRLLGAGRVPGRFKFGPGNPLDLDLVVVDEASMVDMPMMVHLMDSLFPETSLVILGDKDQLASVEAGSVLGDICEGLDRAGYSEEFAQVMAEAGEQVPVCGAAAVVSSRSQQALRDRIVVLHRNYRFSKGGGLAELAAAVNRGDADRALEILSSSEAFPRISLLAPDRDGMERLMEEHVYPWIEALFQAASPEQGLVVLGTVRLLCALRQGPRGIEHINRLVSGRVQEMAGARRVNGTFHAMPLIVNRNDYNIGLYNGDSGIFWDRDGAQSGAWFEDGRGGVRRVVPSRLPPFDQAWAVTVHRSQGSEFGKVIVILPPAGSPVATRELLYTAVTRAREEVVVFGSEAELRSCISRRSDRASGLHRLLWIDRN